MVRRLCLGSSLLLLLGGCAIGKTSAGGYVLGIDVPGGSAETASEGFSAAAAALPGIAARAAAGDWVGALVAGAGTLFGLSGTIFGVRKVNAASNARAEAERLKGEAKGWDDREAAANVQLPLPAGGAE